MNGIVAYASYIPYYRLDREGHRRDARRLRGLGHAERGLL